MSVDEGYYYSDYSQPCKEPKRDTLVLTSYTMKVTQNISKNVINPTEQRLDDITFWKDELNRKLDDTKNEIDTLVAYQTRLRNALEACQEPLAIVNQCLGYR